MSVKLKFASVARTITRGYVFRKRLPDDFGSVRIFVTPRSDIRLLTPGWESSAGDLLLVARRYIKSGDCVWDLGSNLGIFSFCAGYKPGSGGQCFSLEADPKYADLQNRTVSFLPDGFAPVTVLCAAISNEMALLDLVIPKNGHSRNHLALVAGNSAAEMESTKQVVAVTGDFLAMHWGPPNFVKIDVEGAELLALRGSRKVLEIVRPVFYIEVNPENQKEISALFHSLDYRLFSLAPDGREQPVESCAFNTIAKPAEKC